MLQLNNQRKLSIHKQNNTHISNLTILGTLRMVIVSFNFLVLPLEAFSFTPIAHTDVVPYQRIEYGSSFNFGVVAFSKPGINRVDFAISGQGYTGGTKTSNRMKLNPRVASAEYNGVWEYFVPIAASEFTRNGSITVTPTVYDNNGNTRVLDAVTLIVEGISADFNRREAWVDPSRSDGVGTVGKRNDPFPDIQSAVSAAQTENGGDSSGNIIYLEEGTYSISGVTGSTSGEWLTIAKAAEASRNNVVINEGFASVENLKFDSVTLQSRGDAQEVISGNRNHYWTNSCRRIGCGREFLRSNPVFRNHQNPSHTGTYYSTDDYTYDVFYAYQSCTLIRGAVIEKVRNDVFQNYTCVINAKANDVTNGGSYHHSDILQVYQNNDTTIPVSNRLAYNIYATDVHYQGIMRSSIHQTPRDNAYINVFIEMREPGEPGREGANPQIQSALSYIPDDHLLVWHCSFPYSHSVWGDTTTNSSFIGNLFWQDISGTSQQASTEWLHNHFMYVYEVTDSCTGTSRGISSGWPCPIWGSSIKDTGTSTASYGDGVVDISTPGAAVFGYPVSGSTLIDRVPSVYVPCDALGNARDHRPDIGALEYNGGTDVRPRTPLRLRVSD